MSTILNLVQSFHQGITPKELDPAVLEVGEQTAEQVADFMGENQYGGMINVIRMQDLPEGEDFKFVYDLNFTDKGLPGKVDKIKGQDSQIAQVLGKHLGIEGGLDKLFHSPGAVSLLEKGALIDTMYNPYKMGQVVLPDSQRSNVAMAYNDDTLRGMSQQKAALASIFQMMGENASMRPALMQAVIEILGRQSEDLMEKQKGRVEYYRGLYAVNGYAGGVSGSYLYHDTVDRILRHLDPCDSIDIDGIAPIREPLHQYGDYATEVGKESWRVDLLAGIGDELYARLLLHPQEEWDEQISIVAADIKSHFKREQMQGMGGVTDGSILGKLC